MIKEDILIENIVNKTVEIIKDKKGEDIVSMKFSPAQSTICDYFVICNATNIKQAQSICDGLERGLKTEFKVRPSHIEGYETARWILLDYWDIIIHIFLPESREFYGLEKLWADAEIKKH
jgi:ribosome-associated protein